MAMREPIADGGSVLWIAMITVIVGMEFVYARRATLELTVDSSQTRRCLTSASSTVHRIASKRVL
jgi:hypothetical protein